MKTIYKYPIGRKSHHLLCLPKGSKILSVLEQRNEAVLYAIVDPSVKEFDYYDVALRVTGGGLGEVEDYTFIGTISLENGLFIFHVFITQVYMNTEKRSD